MHIPVESRCNVPDNLLYRRRLVWKPISVRVDVSIYAATTQALHHDEGQVPIGHYEDSHFQGTGMRTWAVCLKTDLSFATSRFGSQPSGIGFSWSLEILVVEADFQVAFTRYPSDHSSLKSRRLTHLSCVH